MTHPGLLAHACCLHRFTDQACLPEAQPSLISSRLAASPTFPIHLAWGFLEESQHPHHLAWSWPGCPGRVSLGAAQVPSSEGGHRPG